MINIAICDDEPAMVKEIETRTKSFFADSGTAADISEFYDGVSLLESCADSDYDVIFLDIKMNFPDGMETARRLRRQCFNGHLIFVTVLEDYVFDAFEVSAYDYLVKPLDDEKFNKTMSRLQKRLEGAYLTVQKDGESRPVNLDEIVYFEVLDRKIYIHMADGNVTDYYDRIENLEKRPEISGRDFFRCHRSFLINLKYLKSFGKGLAKMSEGTEIPVSRLRRDDFEKAVTRYLRDK